MTTSSDKNFLAAISHFFGFLVALIVWLLQKEKLPFVRFQAVQAMAFDAVVSVIMILAVICMIGMINA
jgi:uncharacterized membrane protein